MRQFVFDSLRGKLTDGSSTSAKTLRTWIAMLQITLGLMFLSTWASNLMKGYYPRMAC